MRVQKSGSMKLNKSVYECPKCGCRPKSKLFGRLALSVYQQPHGKQMKIHCEKDFCDFVGTLEDYVKIIYENE